MSHERPHRLVALSLALGLAAGLAGCEGKDPEAWRRERPTAWYLLVVHDYALYKGLSERVSKDAEWSVVGVFETEQQCSDHYMNGNVPRTAQDYDRFWGCRPNTDPELGRRRIDWRGFQRPSARRT